jgi:hypothetical protein
MAQVGGVAALHRSHRLELDRPDEVLEAVEEPAPRAEQDGHDVHIISSSSSARMSAPEQSPQRDRWGRGSKWGSALPPVPCRT